MKKSDEENLLLADTSEQMDQRNRQFYEQFPYPWPPVAFYCPTDSELQWRFLNQNLGDYRHQTIPRCSAIWVAGCGTNQAVFTAAHYPNAKVVGSDLSKASLEVAARSAQELGLKNIELHCESINEVTYVDCFDYVICTGVIHHNTNPEAALNRLKKALKPSGVLELMVYNRFHRLVNHAIQKAVRLLVSGDIPTLQSHAEMRIIQKMLKDFNLRNVVGSFLRKYRGRHEAEIADALIQPLEHSYTVESLADMAAACGLEILTPVVNQHDQATGTLEWYLDMPDRELQQTFDDLSDLRRWQVANLLLLEESPMLWFYLHRQDGGRSRLSEASINEEFLRSVFVRTKTFQRLYIRQSSGSYQLSPSKTPYPAGSPDSSLLRIMQSADGITPMSKIFAAIGLAPTFGNVLRARTRLTTSTFPYLSAVPD